MTKTHPNQSRGILISLTILKNTCLFAAFPYIRAPQTAAKIWSKDSFFKSAPLIPTASTNAFHSINLFLFFTLPSSRQIAPSSAYSLHYPQFIDLLWRRAAKRHQSLYGGQFTLQLLNPIFHQFTCIGKWLHKLQIMQKAIHWRNRKTIRRPIPRTPTRRWKRWQRRIQTSRAAF